MTTLAGLTCFSFLPGNCPRKLGKLRSRSAMLPSLSGSGQNASLQIAGCLPCRTLPSETALRFHGVPKCGVRSACKTSTYVSAGIQVKCDILTSSGFSPGVVASSIIISREASTRSKSRAEAIARHCVAQPSTSDDLQQGTLKQSCTNSFNDGRWEAISRRLKLLDESSPQRSLVEGRWVKLICGASFEDVADVRNLSLIYTLAGVDCIDCAADAAIVAAVKEGINAAKYVMQSLGDVVGSSLRTPWVMISINDHEDPHFRKAEFNSDHCPVNCPRPCERVCPAFAIKLEESDKGVTSNHLEGGVIVERCYGCGRCLPICPLGLISARSYVRPLGTVANLIRNEDVDAIEIHTGAGHLKAFQDLVAQLGSALTSLKLIAVSVPDLEESMIPALSAMYTSMQPYLKNLNLWQLDGRPMSGDIGAGATRAAIILAEKVTASKDRPPGYIQLAGGTNAHTATALRNLGLYGRITRQQHGEALKNQERESESSRALISGVAYGGYARKIVHKFLRKMEEGTDNHEVSKRTRTQLELHPSLLADTVLEANVLVDGVKFGRS